MTDVLGSINTRRTPQTAKAARGQVQNSAGGYTFALDDEARLRRFLILGTDGATYYTSAADLTKDNAEVVLRFARDNTTRLVDILLEISLAGRAPKQNPTLFALAAAAGLGDDAGRKYALDSLPRIARTGTHLLIFVRYVEQFRGWGRGLRKAVAGWYTDKDIDKLAYQMVKYRQRENWSQRDLLRLSHPKTGPSVPLFEWINGRPVAESDLPPLIPAFEAAQTGGLREWTVGIIAGLSWEMLPDAALSEPKVWGALLDQGIPMTALIRQLPRLTRLGVARTRRTQIVEQITDGERLRKARVHPINLLVALRTYAEGKSARGSSLWTPEAQIIDALDTAFYASFGNVEPANKRTLLALDVSGSMGSDISNLPLTAREATAAIAMVTAATEPDYDIVGFTSAARARWGWSRDAVLTPLKISPRQRLDDILAYTANLPFGGTDCALPMVHALQQGLSYDTFIVLTDNETWAGNIHPHEALAEYRRKTGIDAKLIVVGMTATGFSIADPNDPGMLDVVGFDTAVPNLISEFSRGL